MRIALAVFLSSCPLLAQLTPSLTLDAQPLATPTAVLDPCGAVQLEGGPEAARVAWRIRFPPLRPPSAGDHALPETEDRDGLWLQERGADGWIAVGPAQLQITACSPDRVEGKLIIEPAGGSKRELAFALAPKLARSQPAQVLYERPIPAFPPPLDQPRPEDLVFCAVGGTGTGFAGAAMVTEQIARLAASGPLDFVLLTGEFFAPSGVKDAADEQWQTKFEKLFDRSRLPCAFYPALGSAEYDGKIEPLVSYGKFNTRWTMPAYTYHFEQQSHGKKILFVALDTTSLSGSIGDARGRVGLRLTLRALEQPADWKIVFGYGSVVASNKRNDLEPIKTLRERLQLMLRQQGVDLYISGDEAVTQIMGPRLGALHVVAGGGGGPEMSGPVMWSADTMCAFTGGGFAWFRFDGDKLEVSLRDVNGNVRYVHQLRH